MSSPTGDKLLFKIKKTMQKTKHISNQKLKKVDRHIMTEKETLKLMIAKNPNVKNLIDKFNLVLIKNS